MLGGSIDYYSRELTTTADGVSYFNRVQGIYYSCHFGYDSKFTDRSRTYAKYFYMNEFYHAWANIVRNAWLSLVLHTMVFGTNRVIFYRRVYSNGADTQKVVLFVFLLDVTTRSCVPSYMNFVCYYVTVWPCVNLQSETWTPRYKFRNTKGRYNVYCL